jgi:hypothetical protein
MMTAIGCAGRPLSPTEYICDRCEALWDVELHLTGWRPTRCPQRKPYRHLDLDEAAPA